MAQQHLKFAIFGNEYQAKKSASIEKILLYLEKKEAEVYVENAYYEFLIRDQHLDVKAAGVFEDYNFDVDYVISTLLLLRKIIILLFFQRLHQVQLTVFGFL